jgi:hypothetical protein
MRVVHIIFGYSIKHITIFKQAADLAISELGISSQNMSYKDRSDLYLSSKGVTLLSCSDNPTLPRNGFIGMSLASLVEGQTAQIDDLIKVTDAQLKQYLPFVDIQLSRFDGSSMVSLIKSHSNLGIHLMWSN